MIRDQIQKTTVAKSILGQLVSSQDWYDIVAESVERMNSSEKFSLKDMY